MTAHGFRYRDPLAAISAFDLNGSTRRAEVKVAVADVTCKSKVGYAATLGAVESDYQTASIRQNAQALAPLKTLVSGQADAVTTTGRAFGD